MQPINCTSVQHGNPPMVQSPRSPESPSDSSDLNVALFVIIVVTIIKLVGSFRPGEGGEKTLSETNAYKIRRCPALTQPMDCFMRRPHIYRERILQGQKGKLISPEH